MNFKKVVFICVLTVSAGLVLSGCTPEKAEALVTAVKSFESKSLQAIVAYEKLFKNYRKLERETNDQIFDQSSSAITTHGKQAVTVDSMISALSHRNDIQGDRSIEREFHDIKIVYASLRNTYESLPKGSILGAEYVGCGQDIVAKATSQLINFSVDINTNPLYPISLRQNVAKYKILVASEQPKDARLVFNEISTAISNYDEKHEEALKLTLAAVEDGIKVHQLLGKYSDVSISDILGVVQYGLDFLGTLNGIDVADATAKLTSIQKELGSKDYWKRIESIPVADIGNCKPESTDTQEK
ncbi:MAG: hypothetical protein GY696_32780 [Gammaproteobacteria bacterium]|nr:hypothetical protein [Gammaproteobacteria bacterium]